MCCSAGKSTLCIVCTLEGACLISQERSCYNNNNNNNNNGTILADLIKIPSWFDDNNNVYYKKDCVRSIIEIHNALV